ncbi:hypothetical protein P691DRAFT_251059 [Macrolepiota fuliginosa MF-IS2]|uniref:Uncharacterized protein n=1 Tax=Macrolepiota fuliginosa MF-IS2 TaxID=1400762 RepID=A0A9P5X824_9AGAR|nr:hypothetical protein P691DRAFT_251059 [Macrolepiota fuliginosa MF-IS2]
MIDAVRFKRQRCAVPFVLYGNIALTLSDFRAALPCQTPLSMFVVQTLFPRFNGTTDKPLPTSIGTIETLLPVERRRPDSPVPTLASIGVSDSQSRDPLHNQGPGNPQPMDTSRAAGPPVNSATADQDTHTMFDVNFGADDLIAAVTTVSNVNSNLQRLLDRKKNQLQQAVILGQRVLAQQIELEERIRHVQEYVVGRPDEEEINHQARVEYRELSDTILSWDAENVQLSAIFGVSTKPSLSSVFAEPPGEASDHKSPASQVRRTNNVAHRSINIEFAMVVGSNLLTEIGRLQTLLTEREKTIQDMKEESTDLWRTLDALKTTLKQQECDSDKYKEGTWNPEVALQDLLFQPADSLETIHHLEYQYRKYLSQAHGSYESESESEGLSIVPPDPRSKHRFVTTKAHKHATGMLQGSFKINSTPN